MVHGCRCMLTSRTLNSKIALKTDSPYRYLSGTRSYLFMIKLLLFSYPYLPKSERYHYCTGTVYFYWSIWIRSTFTITTLIYFYIYSCYRSVRQTRAAAWPSTGRLPPASGTPSSTRYSSSPPAYFAQLSKIRWVDHPYSFSYVYASVVEWHPFDAVPDPDPDPNFHFDGDRHRLMFSNVLDSIWKFSG